MGLNWGSRFCPRYIPNHSTNTRWQRFFSLCTRKSAKSHPPPTRGDTYGRFVPPPMKGNKRSLISQHSYYAYSFLQPMEPLLYFWEGIRTFSGTKTTQGCLLSGTGIEGGGYCQNCHLMLSFANISCQSVIRLWGEGAGGEVKPYCLSYFPERDAQGQITEIGM